MWGLGIRSQVEINPTAFRGGLEQVLPHFIVAGGVCQQLQSRRPDATAITCTPGRSRIPPGDHILPCAWPCKLSVHAPAITCTPGGSRIPPGDHILPCVWPCKFVHAPAITFLVACKKQKAGQSILLHVQYIQTWLCCDIWFYTFFVCFRHNIHMIKVSTT